MRITELQNGSLQPTDYLAVDDATMGTGKLLAAASTSDAGLVRLYDGIDSTDTGKAATANAAKKAYDESIKLPCNPNLLDNWYWMGGGSQQGGSQYPINQRGQTSYSASVYCVDRWKTDASVSVTVNSGNIKVTNSDTSVSKGIFQLYESPSKLLGSTLVGSCLLSDGSFYSGWVTAPSSFPESGSTNVDLFNSTNMRFRLSFQAGGKLLFHIQPKPSTNIQLVAAKLELGKQQTLCYYDGSAWRLREVPNFAEQLLRCQTSKADSNDTYSNYTNMVTNNSLFLYKEATVSVTLSASAWTYVSVSGLSNTPTGYSPIASFYLTGSTVSLRNDVATMPCNTANHNAFMCWNNNASALTGTMTFRVFFMKNDFAKLTT